MDQIKNLWNSAFAENPYIKSVSFIVAVIIILVAWKFILDGLDG